MHQSTRDQFARRQRASSAPSGRRASYCRQRDLPQLLPLWPHDVVASTRGEHDQLLRKLRTALRVERQRGVSGHWTYDVARHARLVEAYAAELADYRDKVLRLRMNERIAPSRNVSATPASIGSG